MKDGFLPYKTSFMLDFVVCALVVLVPLLLYSLYTVKVKKNFGLHRLLQITLGLILLVAVGAFEIDMQWIQGGWENIMQKQDLSPDLLAKKIAASRQVLHIHLVFAVTTPLVWALTIGLALRRFPTPPIPGPHSRLHKPLGWISTFALVATSVTGVWFYYVAFVAP